MYIIKTGDNMNIINKIKKDTNNAPDIMYKKYNNITFIYSEVLTNTNDINEYILKNINNIIDKKETIKNYEELLNLLFDGFIIIIENNKYYYIEVKSNLDRGINNPSNEITIRGPKDSFTENFNKNIGLIRKRIKSKNLWFQNYTIGTETKTKVSLIYMNNLTNKKLIKTINKKLSKINIDGIIDSGYLKDYISNDSNLFPTILTTERPDLVSMSLLEGKVVIVVDNSPYVLILPCFFIDLFHTPDDYYQKPINISFIRIIRLLAFIIAIFIPAYYIAITTHNYDSISSQLLINFISQRLKVPYPTLFEALIMTISFEILRESDMRMASTIGSSVSILGGLVLGEAAVSAGLLSPIMIIVVAISAISGLVFSSIELTSAIRWWRIFFMLIASLLGIYGIYLGLILLLTKLSSMEVLSYPYLYPFSPFSLKEQKDTFIKSNKQKIKYRNLLLSKKNKIRGR